MEVQKKQKIKRVLAQIFAPYARITKLLDRQPKFTILIYHSVTPKHRWAIEPEEFEKQIKFLSSNYPVTCLKNFFNFNKNSFVITFDDGYEDNFYYALPILKKYNCSATFFICTGFISKEIDITQKGVYQGLKPLSIEQIKKMKKEGMDFGCHTHSHSILAKIPLKRAREEICKSKAILEDILEEKINLFAYPLGQPNTFNKNIISILKEEKFQLACSTIWGSNNKKTNPFILRRIRIDPQDTFKDFKAKIQGNWDFIKWFHYFKSFK
jgi:peptidoglycan/xylan/chitin deacetylase (PgdA/CDA1 family)